MVYANFMKVASNSSRIMVNRNNSSQFAYRSQDSLFESSELHSLSISHCPDRCKKMDLDKQLLSLLKKLVPDDKVNHIQELLKKGADPNTVDSGGNRPIHLAINHSPGNLELVLLLIGFGAELDVVNNHGSTPLTFSLQKLCHRTTEILIKRGISLNFQCQRGWSALMIASMVGDLWSVSMLLEHGANVNAYDVYQRTALKYAVEGNYVTVIKELLAYGANPDMCDVLCTYLRKDRPRLDVVNELLLNCASFRGLESCDQASFLQTMKKCLREEETSDACVRTVIKIQMLLTRDPRSVAEFESWYTFASQCCTEIKYMEYYSVSRCSNVQEFLARSLDGIMRNERELEALLPMLANNYFPIYSDILRARLRKPFLRKKFMKMLMYAKKGGETDEIILLNSDINLNLKPYLSDDDITNFVLAAYVKINSPGTIRSVSYRSLYPFGATCNWNDLKIT